TAQRSRHSVSDCRFSLPRPAPKAERILNSEVRSVIRAMSRFATLVQAINRISAMPAINISEALATGPVRTSRSDLIFGRGLEGSRRPGSDERRFASASNAARACGHVTPGFNRATVLQPLLSGLNAAGFQREALPGKSNPGGATPMTVRGFPSIRMVAPKAF